jgi:hypothetical protein
MTISNFLFHIHRIYKGYKLVGAGRFTRKQRKSYIWFHRNKLDLNSIDAYVDFAMNTVALKNGACSMRV